MLSLGEPPRLFVDVLETIEQHPIENTCCPDQSPVYVIAVLRVCPSVFVSGHNYTPSLYKVKHLPQKQMLSQVGQWQTIEGACLLNAGCAGPLQETTACPSHASGPM